LNKIGLSGAKTVCAYYEVRVSEGTAPFILNGGTGWRSVSVIYLREKRPGHSGRGRFYFTFLKLEVRKSKRDLERSAEKISPGSDISMNVVRCRHFKTTIVRSTSQGRNRVGTEFTALVWQLLGKTAREAEM
jgi:hypothetical protein